MSLSMTIGTGWLLNWSRKVFFLQRYASVWRFFWPRFYIYLYSIWTFISLFSLNSYFPLQFFFNSIAVTHLGFFKFQFTFSNFDFDFYFPFSMWTFFLFSIWTFISLFILFFSFHSFFLSFIFLFIISRSDFGFLPKFWSLFFVKIRQYKTLILTSFCLEISVLGSVFALCRTRPTRSLFCRGSVLR